MATRRSPPKRSGPKSEATNPTAPAPAPSDIFSQLEKQVTEIRNITIKVLEEVRCLRYKIVEINRRFETFACTGETLDDLRLAVDRHEAETIELRR